jgi:hypothetical protein
MPTDLPSSNFSWANPTAVGRPPGPIRRGFERLQDAQVIDGLIVVLFLAFFDGLVLLILAGWQSVQCGSYCGMHTHLRLLRQGLVLVPPAMIILPVLIGLLLRRQRLLVIVVQVLICVALSLHNLSEQHTLRGRLDGTVPCWNPQVSPKDCPWGLR